MKYPASKKVLRWPAAIALVAGLLTFSFGSGCERLPDAMASARPAAGAQPSAKVPLVNTDSHRLALQGYDPVSYFEAAGPQKGSPRITFDDGTAIYQFVSDSHRDLFAQHPDQYRPAYGGYCATGVAHGFKVACDPRDYKLSDGKLYLFHNGLFGDAASGWNDQTKATADANWEKATTLKKP